MSDDHVRWWECWRFIWLWDVERQYRDPGWRLFSVGIIRIHTLPPEGVLLTRKHYKGFLLTIRIWLPWEIIRR